MSLTTDPNDPRLKVTEPSGMQEAYLVLTEEERAKGFVRPVRRKYVHVGCKPKHPLRDLTPEEKERYTKFYGEDAKFEEYPESESPVTGRFWKKADLERACGAVTTMAQAIAETYARQPSYYGSTFCCHCGKHFPVEEFVWDGTNERVGS